MRSLRWPSRNHRDYQTEPQPQACRGAAAPGALVDASIAQGPRGGPVHVVNLKIGQGPNAGDYVWPVSFPMN